MPGENEQSLGQIGHLGHDQTTHLRHRLDNQHPWHQRTLGEMPLNWGSFMVTFLIAVAETPGSWAMTRSTSAKG